MAAKVVDELLGLEFNKYERRINKSLIEEVARRVKEKSVMSVGVLANQGNECDSHALEIHIHLKNMIDETLTAIERLRKKESEFNIDFDRAVSEEDKRQIILNFARDLGATKRELRKDAKAFSRWFGRDAIRDRYIRLLNLREQKISFYLNRFAAVSAFIIERSLNEREKVELWDRLSVEESIKPLLAYEGDTRVVCTAFKSLCRTLQALPASAQENSVEESTLQFIYRSAMQARQDVWIQCEALSLLRSLSRSSLVRVLEKRLRNPGVGDDLFLRRRAVKILGECLGDIPALENLVEAVVDDPSAFVRQGVAAALAKAESNKAALWIKKLALKDKDPKVRAAATYESLRLLERKQRSYWNECLSIVLETMRSEQSFFVLKVAILVAVEGAVFLSEIGSEYFEFWKGRIIDALSRVHANAEHLGLRRWAAMGRERIWCLSNKSAQEVAKVVHEAISEANSGSSAVIKEGGLEGFDIDTVGRVLSVYSQEDFGFDLRRGYLNTKLAKGHEFGFRLWRLFHEFRNPSPDKRQAFPHTIGRLFKGQLRAPSSVLSELAETKVPGEPLYISSEEGWRPYLPLVDDMISVLGLGIKAKTSSLYTSEGVTEITAPKSLFRRIAAFAKISLNFPKIARRRNWKGKEDGPTQGYIKSFEEMGFKVDFRPHENESGGQYTEDPAVCKFFRGAIPFAGSDMWGQIYIYFVSVYENTLFELGVFGTVLAGAFCGKHLYSNYTLQKARGSIPLVIGGWGTRGKSGTERLKAAIFGAVGYSFVSKTTGCEALFLLAHPYGKTKEMFLFRPYDKATIWEQRDIIQLANKFKSEVFLWECMGLTPDYVRILQRQWTRDDISTITNTYPDHEDLQGPAGVNIPQVMCNFIPEEGTLITSEEQMLPILGEESRKVNTNMYSIGWLEAGLLTDDILERFPYEEHPYNIALVLGLAEELCIDHDFALKEMADRVVPDIGVLKTYPVSEVRSRKLEFTNGMSANERHGCMSNWTRLSFDKHVYAEDARTWICTVVNNRADRVARSKVFADILVRDIEADRHVLIGNNLKGLQGYIKSAWDKHSARLSLWVETENGDSEDPMSILETLAKKLRVPFKEEHIEARLQAMLEGQKVSLNVGAVSKLWRDLPALRGELVDAGMAGIVDSVIFHTEHMVKSLSEYQDLVEKIKKSDVAKDALDSEMRRVLWGWFSWKIVLVEDYYATGGDVVDAICDACPPGIHCRVMGLQNIKGTGLDFVYRWQAWEACERACRMLRSQDIREMESGLKELAAFQEYGVLCESYVQETVEIVRRSPLAQRERVQAEINAIEANVASAMKGSGNEGGAKVARKEGKIRWVVEKMCEIAEQFLDAGDAIKRRKVANTLYKDLVSERVSIDRAALELQGLNKRQKGGWLLKKVLKLYERFGSKKSIFALPK